MSFSYGSYEEQGKFRLSSVFCFPWVFLKLTNGEKDDVAGRQVAGLFSGRWIVITESCLHIDAHEHVCVDVAGVYLRCGNKSKRMDEYPDKARYYSFGFSLICRRPA